MWIKRKNYNKLVAELASTEISMMERHKHELLQSYSMQAKCINCGKNWTHNIERGSRADEEGQIECPNCGVTGLHELKPMEAADWNAQMRNLQQQDPRASALLGEFLRGWSND